MCHYCTTIQIRREACSRSVDQRRQCYEKRTTRLEERMLQLGFHCLVEQGNYINKLFKLVI